MNNSFDPLNFFAIEYYGSICQAIRITDNFIPAGVLLMQKKDLIQ
jgi:hypothetical protein